MATVDDVVLLASAARTETTVSADQHNDAYGSVQIVVDVTVVSGSASLVPKIQGKDRASGKYYDLVTGGPLTATGTDFLNLGPAAPTVAGRSRSWVLPTDWRFVMEHATADPCTYSVGATLAG